MFEYSDDYAVISRIMSDDTDYENPVITFVKALNKGAAILLDRFDSISWFRTKSKLEAGHDVISACGRGKEAIAEYTNKKGLSLSVEENYILRTAYEFFDALEKEISEDLTNSYKKYKFGYITPYLRKAGWAILGAVSLAFLSKNIPYNDNRR